ncbi:MAG: hypothetical protein NT157_02715 [Candidatus Micrarchaeota archaeon]|nr:hypothetical protein [Candidatus Micrarchaeota archaeon]
MANAGAMKSPEAKETRLGEAELRQQTVARLYECGEIIGRLDIDSDKRARWGTGIGQLVKDVGAGKKGAMEKAEKLNETITKIQLHLTLADRLQEKIDGGNLAPEQRKTAESFVAELRAGKEGAFEKAGEFYYQIREADYRGLVGELRGKTVYLRRIVEQIESDYNQLTSGKIIKEEFFPEIYQPAQPGVSSLLRECCVFGRGNKWNKPK